MLPCSGVYCRLNPQSDQIRSRGAPFYPVSKLKGCYMYNKEGRNIYMITLIKSILFV